MGDIHTALETYKRATLEAIPEATLDTKNINEGLRRTVYCIRAGFDGPMLSSWCGSPSRAWLACLTRHLAKGRHEQNSQPHTQDESPHTQTA